MIQTNGVGMGYQFPVNKNGTDKISVNENLYIEKTPGLKPTKTDGSIGTQMNNT